MQEKLADDAVSTIQHIRSGETGNLTQGGAFVRVTSACLAGQRKRQGGGQMRRCCMEKPPSLDATELSPRPYSLSDPPGLIEVVEPVVIDVGIVDVGQPPVQTSHRSRRPHLSTCISA
jgi:hypothetical protein